MTRHLTGDTKLFLSFVFVIALLFFGISQSVINDVKNKTENSPAPVVNIVHVNNVMASTTDSEAFVDTTPKGDDVVVPNTETTLNQYIEIIDSCTEHFGGECLQARSGPDTSYPSRAKLRNGVVLKTDGTVVTDGRTWYKIVFDEWLRYPERVKGTWYVAGDYVKVINDVGPQDISTSTPATSTKRILVSRSEQKLYAYDGDTLFMTATTSTGLDSTPTPRGVFKIYRKTPSRYMQGPLPYLASDQYYDLPGVPWNLYFTEGGAVIHGAYWHNSFGTQYSHGCVNLEPDIAHQLYQWAEVGTTVTVRD